MRGCVVVNSTEKSPDVRFLSAVEVRTAGGVTWIAAAFHTRLGLLEAVYRVHAERTSFETAYLGAVGYWDTNHPFWRELVVLTVHEAPPNTQPGIPARVLRELGMAGSPVSSARPFMWARGGGRTGGRRAVFPIGRRPR